MKRIILAVLCVSSFGIAGGDFKDVEPAVVPVVPIAEEDKGALYVGLGLIYNRIYTTKSSWFNKVPLQQDQTGGLSGIVGYDFNEYIAVEGRITKTLFERDYADMWEYSIFLKPQYPVTEDFKVYGLLGFGLVQVDGYDGNNPAANIGSTILDDTGFQWGLGASYMVTEDLSLFADYTSSADDADIDLMRISSGDPAEYDELSVDGITIGLLYHF